MKKTDLNGKWHISGISPEGESIELLGNVPGNTLDALLDNTKGFDVFYRDNAEKVQKYEKYNWTYTKKFHIEKTNKQLLLYFDRLDTYCDVFVNDIHIACCENGFISHTFDITNAIITGDNTVKVQFYSPVLKAQGKEKRSFCAFSSDRLHTRRIQCTYGWDWTMRFVTCGIGNTYIEEITDEMQVSNLYVYTKSIDSDCAEVVADIDFMNFENGGIIKAELFDAKNKSVYCYERYNEESFMRIHMDIATPMLWNPINYGKPNLYHLIISCENRILYTTDIGIRTVKIMQLKDSVNDANFNKCLELQKTDSGKHYDKNTEFYGFILKVNDKKIMCKGANWVPCEPFGISDNKKKITELLELAANAGINILRIWGGGAFECEHFYDECSRLGIMVVQDFLMACGDYPEEQPWFLEHLNQEAEYAVQLLRNKPCLMWWNGDNENAISGTNHSISYHGRNSAYKGIGPVLYKKDYSRVFMPSSPFGGDKYASATSGTTHNTQFLGHLFNYIETDDMHDFKEKYKEFRARFISEEPAMGAVSLPSLKKFMTTEDIYGDNLEIWLYHTKNNPSLKTELFDYELIMAEKLFGKFVDGKDRFFKLKYLQYEWIRISLEQVRREKWFSAGIIYWMYNDCWPASSGWSLVDYYGIPKASYYSFMRGAKSIVSSIDYDNGNYTFYVSNDGKKQQVKIKCYTLSGKTIFPETTVPICENCSQKVFESNEQLANDDMLFMEVTDESGIFDRAFYKQGKLILKPIAVDVTERNDHTITVTASSYVHAVELEGECIFGDNYFSLLPGETRTISYIGNGSVDICGYTINF